ncbi:MAG: amidase [Erythrobacter sp.]
MIDRYNAFLYYDESASGAEGPLAGVTVGVKPNIAVKGMPFHAGIGSLADQRADRDAEVVRRLREAGAIITGVLNMEEGALGAKTDNPHFGPVQNPHRDGYSPGGSSGGSGAAVAAELCAVALGTDTMGSIRIPAAHCGVYGFKPATDRVSQDGLITADPALDAIGPLARDLDMLERVARVMSEFGDGETTGPGATLANHGVEIHPEVATVFSRALSALPKAPATERMSESNSRIRFAGFIRVAKTLSEDLSGVVTSDKLANLLSYGALREPKKLALDMDVLNQASLEVRHIVAKRGFLILPTVPNPPFPHSDPEPATQADLTCLANIAGLPVISIPAGWTDDGLPIGVQIVGEVGAEAGLFDLARQLDAELNAYRPPKPRN